MGVVLSMGFLKFINYSLRGLFLIIILWTIKSTIYSPVSLFSITSILCFILFSLLLWTAQRKKINPQILLGIILCLGIILRILWFFNIDSLPASDFRMMYDGGTEFIRGDYWMFWGTSYFARFPHMTLTVIYFGLIQKVFSDPLTAIRFINFGLSIINMIFMYFIAQRVFNDTKKSLWVLFLTSIYPPMIYYNNVFASENLAMPLLLASVLCYFKALDKKSTGWFISSGLLLSTAHLFRPLGYVLIVAYIMHGLIYYKMSLKKKLQFLLTLVTSSLVPYVLTGLILFQLGVTQYPLWHATEPYSISVLKGTNLSSNGRWNAEDAALFDTLGDNYEAFDAESKRIIKERLTQTPKGQLLAFFVNKFGAQWMDGSFAGAYWAESGRDDEKAQARLAQGNHSGNRMFLAMDEHGSFYSQIVLLTLYLLAYAGLFRKGNPKNSNVTFLWILFCGFGLFYLITESQQRYAYIASWIFPLLALTASPHDPHQSNTMDLTTAKYSRK